MYDYRTWTPEKQISVVAQRQKDGLPWHGPPHFDAPGEYRIVTGACYEHRSILAASIAWSGFPVNCFPASRKSARLAMPGWSCPVIIIILVQIGEMKEFSHQLGKLHGRTSHTMNKEDGADGRQVWYRCQDRCMRSESHYYATMNYIHNNPVKHGYVTLWTDWPFSSFHGVFGVRRGVTGL